MMFSCQRIRGAATVALAAVIAASGSSVVVRAATRSVTNAVLSPRQDDSGQKTAVLPKHLAGVVRDDEGRPVAGATVVAGQYGGGQPNHRIATTGSDGRFDLAPDEKSARLEYVLAHKDGLAAASLLRIPRDNRAEDCEVLLRLRKPVPFTGLVKDSAGRPVAGALAHIQYAQYEGSDGSKMSLNAIEHVILGTPLEHAFRATTDEHGQFVFAVLPGGAQASLLVTAAGMGDYNTMNRRGPNGRFDYLVGTLNAPAVVVLEPAARVAGRVVARFRSVKVGGLKIAIQGSRDSHGIWAETTTDVEGRFEFNGLAAGTANIFLMDYQTDGLWTYRAPADKELRPGQTTEVAIELIRGVHVEGKVIDARNGNPVASVGVGVYGPMRPRTGAAIVSATTDNDGRYQFRLPPGQTYFYICGPVPAEFGQQARGGHTVEIPVDARDFTVPDIEIRPEVAKAGN
jgi:hypothetical protein